MVTLVTIASSVAPSSTSAALGMAANCDPATAAAASSARSVVPAAQRARAAAHAPLARSWPFTSERSRPVTMIPVASPIAATASAVFVRASSENHATEATDGASASAIALASACAVPVLS